MTASHIPLPAGAEFADDWQPASAGQPAYRIVWAPRYGDQDITACCFQREDGTIAPATSDDPPAVHIGDWTYTPAAARQVAEAILAAAEQAERWAGQ